MSSPVEVGSLHFKDQLEVSVAEVPLKVASVHIVRKSVVGGEKQVDGVELAVLGQGCRHVREGLVEGAGGGRPASTVIHCAEVPQSLAVGRGSSNVSETFL